tara:strand:+ start:594 stop:881 length:288 start_codon:yes stop_codon:yes gene_type:complete
LALLDLVVEDIGLLVVVEEDQPLILLELVADLVVLLPELEMEVHLAQYHLLLFWSQMLSKIPEVVVVDTGLGAQQIHQSETEVPVSFSSHTTLNK